MPESTPSCLACQATQDQAPLIQIVFQGKNYHICAEHFPLLIHSPQKLVGKLPGAEKLKGHEH
jgi:hypothetical protein